MVFPHDATEEDIQKILDDHEERANAAVPLRLVGMTFEVMEAAAGYSLHRVRVEGRGSMCVGGTRAQWGEALAAFFADRLEVGEPVKVYLYFAHPPGTPGTKTKIPQSTFALSEEPDVEISFNGSTFLPAHSIVRHERVR